MSPDNFKEGADKRMGSKVTLDLYQAEFIEEEVKNKGK
jgi:hypothetical protein